ncbi:MAG: SUMF1/EgtB/PvdO family nonheme iron enzyme [Bryobacteraceae bacterium]
MVEHRFSKLKVFLCHASGDKEPVRVIHGDLARTGWVQPWLDEVELLPGQRWRDSIQEALREAHVVAVCLSQRSVAKEGFVQREISLALDAELEKPFGTIYIVPILLEPCPLPARLREFQAVEIFKPTGRIKLLEALARRALSLGIGHRPTPGEASTSPLDGEQYVWIPPGDFFMGASPGDEEALIPEFPRRRVTISRGFWIGQTPVTIRGYRALVPATTSVSVGTESPDALQLPMVAVTWSQAASYCALVGGRLPREAEWEYAARAGSNEPRYGPLDEVAWYAANSNRRLQPVGGKKPNPWNLYDMLGNVYEWCDDWKEFGAQDWDSDEEVPEYRMIRGGSFIYPPVGSRASNRGWCSPDRSHEDLGFRVVLDAEPLRVASFAGRS